MPQTTSAAPLRTEAVLKAEFKAYLQSLPEILSWRDKHRDIRAKCLEMREAPQAWRECMQNHGLAELARKKAESLRVKSETNMLLCSGVLSLLFALILATFGCLIGWGIDRSR